MRIEREKKEIKEKVDAVKAKIEAYTAKVKCCQTEQENQENEEKRNKITDLVEKSSGDRKFLKAGSREFSNGVLAEKRCYQFCEIKKNAEEEEEP